MSVVTLGCQLGPYEITDLLGRGGMGEIYRAVDTKLNRVVALKLLHSTAAGPIDTERLIHEARLMSTLNHPHIRAVYDATEIEGIAVIVMEYVDGETLDQRIAHRQISLGTAVKWAQQLADALDVAHSHDIVHHDVKPANVMVTPQGVKLLDFGIATPRVTASTLRGAVEANTVTDGAGVPGTTAYMAPEHLEGCTDDPRSDIFSLGVVLYEMIAGRKPFDAPTRARTIAAILEHEPPTLTSMNAAVSPAVSRAVTKCLAKDPAARWQTARDLSSELAWLSQGDPSANATTSSSSSRHLRTAWAVAAMTAAFAVAAVVALSVQALKPQTSSAPIRFLANPPANTVLTVIAGSFSISPDGRYLAFTASRGGGPRLLWLRSLDSFEAHSLSGTEDAGFPFWSPDSRTIAFFTNSNLKTIDITGSPLQIVTKLPREAQWGTWGRHGDILFTSTQGRALYRVRASGGLPNLLVGEDNAGRRFGGPEVLPDGDHFLLGVVEPDKPLEQVSIYVGSFDKPMERILLRADSQVAYTEPGYVLYIRAGTLIVQAFNAGTQRLTGEPFSLPEPVAFVRAQRRASFTVSQNGILAYRQGIPTTQLTWFDRTGQRLSTVGSAGRYLNPAISPDGNGIAVTRLGSSVTESDIWLFETRGERPLTSSPGLKDYPVWSPDGKRLVYSSNEAGFMDLYAKDSAASSQESGTLVLKSRHQKGSTDWTPDGKQIIFLDSPGFLTPRLPMMFAIGSGQSKAEELTLAKNPGASPRSEDQVQISPDGHWMAYVSDMSGAAQVYVRQFPDGQRRWQVSTDGGFEPKWRGDGRELFYIATDQQMMSVTVNSTLLTFEASRPIPLFRATVLGAPFQNGVVRNEYAVTRDGQRFLVNEPIDGAAAYGVRVLANWQRLLSTGGPKP